MWTLADLLTCMISALCDVLVGFDARVVPNTKGCDDMRSLLIVNWSVGMIALRRLSYQKRTHEAAYKKSSFADS